MSRFVRKFLRALAGLVGGYAFACSPNEAPPMGPRPDPVQPTPDHPPDRESPIPGAPDPIPAPIDGGVSSVIEITPVELAPAAPKPKAPADAGVPVDAPPPPDAPPPDDAGIPLPPLPDGGLPPDASRRAE